MYDYVYCFSVIVPYIFFFLTITVATHFDVISVYYLRESINYIFLKVIPKSLKFNNILENEVLYMNSMTPKTPILLTY